MTIATTRSSRSRFATSRTRARPDRSTRASQDMARWLIGQHAEGQDRRPADHQRGGPGRHPLAAHDDRARRRNARRSRRPAMDWAGASTITAATAGSTTAAGSTVSPPMTTLFPEDGLGLVVLSQHGRDTASRDGLAARGRPAPGPRRRSTGAARSSQEEKGQGRRQGRQDQERHRPPAAAPRPPIRSRNMPAITSIRATASSESSSDDGKLQLRIQRHRSAARALALRGLQRAQEPEGPGLRGR